MTGERAADWSISEFAILLASPRISDAELTHDLSGRTEGAIAVVRQGIHLMDKALPAHGMLSAAMIRFLEPRLPLPACAVCIGTSGRPS